MSTGGSTAPTDPLRPLRLPIAVVLFGGTALVALFDWLAIGGSSVASTVNGPIYDAVILSAGLACLLKALGAGRERAAWLLIAGAVLCWAAAEIYWTAFLVDDPSPPYPSPADLGYLAFYPLAAAGVLMLVRERARELDWRLWMDGLIAALGTAALGTALIFEYVADHTSGSTLQEATTLAYPLADVAMLSLVVGVVALTRWRPGRTWTLLLLGLAALVIADVSYTLQSTAVLPQGDWIEPIYLLGAVFLGAEAWQPQVKPIRPVARFDGWRELMIPGFFAVLTIGLFAIQYSTQTSPLTAMLTTATILAVIARLAISVRENKRLLEEVRRDGLTGLGNQGSMRVDLAARCHRAEEEPLTMVLLDLNGFKRFNDTFGHPAGDEILARMGAQLREAVGNDGSAYRIGGDEFAVLIGCGPRRREIVRQRVVEALSARGPGFELGAAWGAVAIPEEARIPNVAMELADVRMYAQKDSQRGAGGSLTAGPERIKVATEASAGSPDGLGRRLDREALEQRQQ